METITKQQRFRAKKLVEEPWYFHAVKLKSRTLEAGGLIKFDEALSVCREVWIRDEGKCQYGAGEAPCKGVLAIHHLDGNPLNNESWNLRVVCNSHHRGQHEPAHLGHKHTEKTKALLRKQRLGKRILRIDLGRLRELNEAGNSKTEIGRQMEISREAVRNNMKRYGIESKSRDGRSQRTDYPERDDRGKWIKK